LSATNFLQKSYTFDYSTIFDSTELILLLQKHISIIRAKGFIRTEMGWKLLNFTLTECLFEDAEDGMETEFVIIMDKSEPYLANILADEIGKTIHLKQQIY
jgi:hypothetical protein